MVTLSAVTTLFDLFRQLTAAPAASEISYALHGRVYLANSPARLSFSREGSFDPAAR